MADRIVRGLTIDGYVKVSAITAKDLVERARGIHRTQAVGTAALGRTLMACSLMGNQLKEEAGSVTLRIRGGGPLGTLLAVSDCEGNVRGYVQNPDVELPLKCAGKLDVGSAVGADGTLTVIKDIGLKEPYIGSISLVGGEIAEDIAAYFAESEQIPTACALGVLIDTDYSVLAAGGYLLQLLPGAPEETVAELERCITGLEPVSSLLARGMEPEELLRTVLAGLPLEILEETPVEYRCYCSRERVVSALFSMSEEELRSLCDEGEEIRTSCQFCDREYCFTPVELKEILDRKIRRNKEN